MKVFTMVLLLVAMVLSGGWTSAAHARAVKRSAQLKRLAHLAQLQGDEVRACALYRNARATPAKLLTVVRQTQLKRLAHLARLQGDEVRACALYHNSRG